MNLLKKLIVTGLGTGYLRPAPGTWGSGGAAAAFLVACYASSGSVWAANGTMAVVAVLASIGCVALGRFAESAFGRKDPSYCTIDEWAGQAVSLLLVPLGAGPRDWYIAAGVAFVAFRLFDIVKPPPARQFEKLPYGWGVLLDDLAAGVYANIVSQLILRFGFHLL